MGKGESVAASFLTAELLFPNDSEIVQDKVVVIAVFGGIFVHMGMCVNTKPGLAVFIAGDGELGAAGFAAHSHRGMSF